jgi:hypothetical protein
MGVSQFVIPHSQRNTDCFREGEGKSKNVANLSGDLRVIKIEDMTSRAPFGPYAPR